MPTQERHDVEVRLVVTVNRELTPVQIEQLGRDAADRLLNDRGVITGNYRDRNMRDIVKVRHYDREYPSVASPGWRNSLAFCVTDDERAECYEEEDDDF